MNVDETNHTDLGISSSDAFTEGTNKTLKMSRTEMLGCMRGQFTMSDDFDAPLDDFKEYV
jgi:hypothetical protein